LLPLLVLLACAPQHLEPETAAAAPAPLPAEQLLIEYGSCAAPAAAALSRDQVLQDLELLELALRQGYAGFDELARQGLDWEALFHDMRAGVARLREPISTARLQDYALQHLAATGDQHLALFRVTEEGWWIWRSAGAHQDPWIAEPRLLRDEQGGWRDPTGRILAGCQGYDLDALLQPVLASLEPLELAWAPLLLAQAEPPPLQCDLGGEAVELPLRPLPSQDLGEGPAYEATALQGMQLLRLRDLSLEQGQLLAAFAAAGRELASEPVLLDLRGNGGGSDRTALEFFGGRSSTALACNDVARLESLVTLLGRTNWRRCSLDREQDPDRRQELEAELRRLAARRALATVAQQRDGHASRSWERWTPELSASVSSDEPAPLVALMDRGCASSCETAALLARQLPDGLLLGENSGGVGVFGESLRYRLPNSGLNLMLGSKHFQHPDPALAVQEGVGHIPDLWLVEGDAQVAAQAVLACLGEESCAEPLRDQLARPLPLAVARHVPESAPIEPLLDPASLGVAPEALAELMRRAEESRTDALVILVDGQPLVSWPERQRPIETMSVTKSILQLAIGKLLEEGAIPSLETPVAHFFPQWSEGPKAAVTLRMLLEHSSGLAAPPSREIRASGDFLRFALDSQLDTEPDTVWKYNNNATNLVAGIASQAAGQPADAYMEQRFFQPMGITTWKWDRDVAGNTQGGAGLALRAEDLARFGILMLDQGRWGERQLVNADWVASSTRAAPLNPRCGRLWWLVNEVQRSEDDGATAGSPGFVQRGFKADGWLGQYLVVIPERRIVAVRQMRSRPEHWKYGDEGADSFKDFEKRVLELVR